MMSKKQKLLMKVIYSHAIRKEGVCLIRPIDLLKEIPLSSDFRRDELESNLKALVIEDFFEMITTDKKGKNTIALLCTRTVMRFRDRSRRKSALSSSSSF